MDLERVQQITPFSLTKQWYEAGVVVDPGTVTVGITRADGSVLVAAGASTTGTGTSPRRYDLTAADTALLDWLTVTWTSTLKGTLYTRVEVVGGFLFRLDELSSELGTSTTTYTAAQMSDARTYAETQLEHECGVAFAARYELESFSGGGTTTQTLKWPRVTTVRSVTIDGASVSPVSSVVAVREGLAYYSSGWTAGYGNVQIGYEHGDSVLNPGASEAALVLAKHKLVKGPIDERATQRASEFGPVNLATPGMFGSRFGIPVVDAFIVANNMNVGIA